MIPAANEILLFAALAAVNIATPGPGVALTLTNAMQRQARVVFAGILGVASGTFVVASLSAMGIGAVLMTSTLAFAFMKYAGAAYLVYLGVKIWRAPAVAIGAVASTRVGIARHFAEGFVLQISNPNAILFFLALFPQFIDHRTDGLARGALLVAGYAILIVIIHSLYGIAALRARTWLGSQSGGRVLNRVSGSAFVIFGAALAASNPR